MLTCANLVHTLTWPILLLLLLLFVQTLQPICLCSLLVYPVLSSNSLFEMLKNRSPCEENMIFFFFLVVFRSCGDDGRIQGWRWKEILEAEVPIPSQGN